MNKLKNFIVPSLVVGAGMVPMLYAKAADFDATSTQEIVTTAFGNVTPTLKTGIIAVIGVALGIWAVFFLVGKLRKHTR